MTTKTNAELRAKAEEIKQRRSLEIQDKLAAGHSVDSLVSWYSMPREAIELLIKSRGRVKP